MRQKARSDAVVQRPLWKQVLMDHSRMYADLKKREKQQSHKIKTDGEEWLLCKIPSENNVTGTKTILKEKTSI